MSTRRYYKTYQIQDLSDTGVPVGTAGLIQIQDLSDTGVPVGTTGLIQIHDLSDTGLIRYRSTRRYYKTYPNTGVPLGTMELIRSGLNQRQELIRDMS